MRTPDPDDPETLDRNWNELLQELRVAQTGVQILTGFLLTLPFTERFSELDRFQVTTYLVVIAGAVLTTGSVVAPVAFHRILFRHRQRRWLVESANQCARAGLLLLALTSSGVLLLVFDVVLGTGPGLVALGVALLFFTATWVVVPLVGERGGDGPTRRS